MRLLAELFLTFARIGAFTFGGGYAMLAMIEDACVSRKGWITHEEMMDITVIAESTPGPIAINCATFTGYKKAGMAGALAATLGIIVPSFVCLYLVSLVLDHAMTWTLITHAFRGIKIAVAILILDAAVTMLRKMPRKRLPRVLMASAAVAMLCINIFAWNFSSVCLMLIAAAISLTVFAVQRARGQGGGDRK